MVDMSPSSTTKSHRKKGDPEDTNDTGFDMNLSSKGSLAVSFSGVSVVQDKSGMIKNVFKSIEQLESATDYSAGSLMDVTRVATIKQRKESAKIENIVELVDKAVSIPFKQRSSSYFRALSVVVAHLKEYNSDLSLLLPYFSKMPTVATLPDTLFYILSRVGSESAQMLISKYGLMIANRQIQMSAFFSVSNIEHPTQFLVEKLIKILETSNDETISAHALYALTNTIRNSRIESVRNAVKVLLIARMNTAAKHKNKVSIISTLLAIKNAGGSFFVQRNQLPYNLLLSLGDHSIHQLLSQLYPYSSAVVTPMSFGFPFNKSVDDSKKLGGSVASITFGANLFAGTNFDCNQPTFNYEACADATADGSLFGVAFQALNAKAIYGKANGVVIGDSMFLEIFGKTIYSHTFPVLDCNVHTYPIAHASPGFSVSYTVWVSIIPITFSAGADLGLNLQWGWEICDSPL